MASSSPRKLIHKQCHSIAEQAHIEPKACRCSDLTGGCRRLRSTRESGSVLNIQWRCLWVQVQTIPRAPSGTEMNQHPGWEVRYACSSGSRASHAGGVPEDGVTALRLQPYVSKPAGIDRTSECSGESLGRLHAVLGTRHFRVRSLGVPAPGLKNRAYAQCSRAVSRVPRRRYRVGMAVFPRRFVSSQQQRQFESPLRSFEFCSRFNSRQVIHCKVDTT